MTRTRKSIWGFASGMMHASISLGIGLIAAPWLLHWLGSERFGTYRVLLDWLGYLELLELGLGASLLALLATALSRGEGAAVGGLLGAGFRAYLRMTAIMLLGGFGLMAAMPSLLQTNEVSSDEIQLAWLIWLAVCLMTPLSVFRKLAEARQQAYLVHAVMTLQSVVMTGLLLFTAWAGWGLPGLGLATVAAQLMAVGLFTWYGIRTCAWTWLNAPPPSVGKKLWRLNWPTFVHDVSGRVGLLSDNVVVAWVLGPLAVVPFYLTQRLATIVLMQLQGLGNATWAGLVELSSQGRSDLFRLRLLELTGLVSGLALVILGPVLAYNSRFIALWVGPVNFAGPWVNLLVCLNVWLWTVFGLWGWPISGTGQIARWVPYALGATTINLVISIAGTFLWGMVGPLVGTLAAFVLVYSWGQPRVLKDLFEVSPMQLWKAALVPMTWGIPYVGIVWHVARIVSPENWLQLSGAMSLTGLVGLALWWSLSLSANDRSLWIVRLQGAFGR